MISVKRACVQACSRQKARSGRTNMSQLQQMDPRDALCHAQNVSDAQCGKLAMDVGRTARLTTVATVYMPRMTELFLSAVEIETKFNGEMPLMFRPEFRYNIV